MDEPEQTQVFDTAWALFVFRQVQSGIDLRAMAYHHAEEAIEAAEIFYEVWKKKRAKETKELSKLCQVSREALDRDQP